MPQKVYALDFDYTLINADSSTLWCHFLAEQGLVADPEGFLRRERRLMEAYGEGSMRVQDYIAFSMGAIRHLPAAEVNELCRSFVNAVLPQHIYPEALKLVEQIKRNDDVALVISASASCIVRPGAALLGLEAVAAVEPEIKDGYYSGGIISEPTFKSGKVRALRAFMERCGLEGLPVHAYTDSCNDLPLCLAADLVSVVNPDAALYRAAQRQGYEVLRWRI